MYVVAYLLSLGILLTRSTASKSVDEPEDKAIVRLAITYGVLRRLGFSAGRVEECLKVINGVDMDEAFEWVRTFPMQHYCLLTLRSRSFTSIAMRKNWASVKVCLC